VVTESVLDVSTVTALGHVSCKVNVENVLLFEFAKNLKLLGPLVAITDGLSLIVTGRLTTPNALLVPYAAAVHIGLEDAEAYKT
jgi:hypothetical protein